DEAMAQVAESIRERDIRIVALEQLVTDLTREPAPPPLTSPYVGARRRALPEGVNPVPQPGTALAAAPLTPQTAEGRPPEAAPPAETTWSAETAWSRESARPAEPGWPADATRPDLPAWPGESAEPEAGPEAEPEAEPEAGPAAEAPPSPGEGQVGPPERSHG
ncbi:MAG TPA: hypothetical protein VFE26_12035, partial [Trebonia sp.]|nr:hypothetical protein [Trebonia sp.]